MQKIEDQMKRIYKKYLIVPQSEKPESGTWKGAGYSSYGCGMGEHYINYWKCNNCGAVMTWKGRFCPGCGLPMVNADEPDEENMQFTDLREEQEERLGVAPILNPKTT